MRRPDRLSFLRLNGKWILIGGRRPSKDRARRNKNEKLCNTLLFFIEGTMLSLETCVHAYDNVSIGREAHRCGRLLFSISYTRYSYMCLCTRRDIGVAP